MHRSQRRGSLVGPLVIHREEATDGAWVLAARGEASNAHHSATLVPARRGRGETSVATDSGRAAWRGKDNAGQWRNGRPRTAKSGR
ncbi:hypothetical protein E2562_034425 [Oryza meyeriana var. granulata]|uniref:Uncharacterized protein n=1 Tax=Oryza meyeriana var. granulata TaxID=110450 RepID=A0A6G1BPR2_9ORYZ|nr:hypothetical protein E2562_034425 [Oryza meyeriana var. granulata]